MVLYSYCYVLKFDFVIKVDISRAETVSVMSKYNAALSGKPLQLIPRHIFYYVS